MAAGPARAGRALAGERLEFDPSHFNASVSAATSMFGDPSRRHIYLFVRGAAHGVTAAEVAERFDLHTNVARHHLDKLVAGGYVEVRTDSAAEPATGSDAAGSDGPGSRDSGSRAVRPGRAGRPSKRYWANEKAVELEFPVRRHDLLVTLLGRALELLSRDQAEAMAEQVGYDYGRELAEQMSPGDGHRSMQNALHAVADALTAHGFAAHAEKRGGFLAIVSDECPFGEMSNQHPVICAVDRGIVRGMLQTLHGASDPAQTSTRALGADACVTTI